MNGSDFRGKTVGPVCFETVGISLTVMLTRFPERAHLTSKWALISAYGAMEGGGGGHMGRSHGKDTSQR